MCQSSLVKPIKRLYTNFVMHKYVGVCLGLSRWNLRLVQNPKTKVSMCYKDAKISRLPYLSP
jgi:hypothetical protein